MHKAVCLAVLAASVNARRWRREDRPTRPRDVSLTSGWAEALTSTSTLSSVIDTSSTSTSSIQSLPAAPSTTIPSTTIDLVSISTTQSLVCALPTSPLTNEEQVGNSILGTLCQPAFPKWLNGTNGKTYDEPPWGNRTTTNSDATIKGAVPDTGVTRHYDFTISRGLLSPDGVLRDVMFVNGQFPGPVIEANWGDWIQVTVHNNITDPDEGTAMHWHGMLQRHSQWEDGVPAVSQCPIAPGQSHTYKFQAEIYGTSFYHAHYSAQYTAGIVGAMQIYGPWQVDYDIDLGPVMLSDWDHIPYFSMVDDVVGTDFAKIPPLSDNGLINGRNQFDCSQPSYDNTTEMLGSNLWSNITWTCVDGAERSQFKFQSGKTHRLRLMNTGANGVQKFSIDGHTMTVIATDYVPTAPYDAEFITLGIGQRTDVLVTATGTPQSSYWMRTELPGSVLCGGLDNTNPSNSSIPQILAAIYYEEASTAVLPTSTPWIVADPTCENDPLPITQPMYPIQPSSNAYIQDVLVTLAMNATGAFEWRINNQTFRADFNEPLLYKAAHGNLSFPDDPQWNVYNFGSNTSIVMNVTNQTPFVHPFHLHGHTFYVLSTGGNGSVWNGSIDGNPENPMRRDVQLVPEGGYAAIQFDANNPGVWPFHCHVAWHLSGGLSMNLVTRPDEIKGIPAGERGKTCDAWDAWTSTVVVDQIDSGS